MTTTTETRSSLAVTPHAFQARVAQLTGQGYRETTEYTGHLEWTAFFAEETDPTGGQDFSYEVCPYTTCKLIGAWAEDGDTGQLYAGNRDELAAMLGEVTIRAWEAYAEELANE